MTDLIDRLAASVQTWDRKDIYELRSALAAYFAACKAADCDPVEIDMAALPSADIPSDVDTGYPVWAMDTSGMMLVGDDASSVMHLDDYRAA